MKDTIAAIATSKGRNGIGVIRVSGPNAFAISKIISGKAITPRKATYTSFRSKENILIDQGIILYFKKPNSFTGEDVIEFQGHGGVVVMDQLLSAIIALDARLAHPGEFSQRAFLNGKINLAEAEAVADLINASSVQAAQSALRSLKGKFSKTIKDLLDQLIHLRIILESAIDFPEEAIDSITKREILKKLKQLLNQIKVVMNTTRQGVLLQEGLKVVILGKPNVGKSSLLNLLTGQETAIVTNIPGTTRDVVREKINLDGLPIHIIDTAGLRNSQDPVEQEGIRRANQEAKEADVILLVEDIEDAERNPILYKQADLIVKNKIDLKEKTSNISKSLGKKEIYFSAKTGIGLENLKKELKKIAGFATSEGSFIARRRHLEALRQTKKYIEIGLENFQKREAAELLGEDLKLAQKSLSEITGEFTSEHLLEQIFSEFCIGK